MYSTEERTLKLCQRDYIWPPPLGRAHWEYTLKRLEMYIFLTKKIPHQKFTLRK